MPLLNLPYESYWVVVIGLIALFGLLLAFIGLISTSGYKRKLKKWKSIHETADLEEVYNRTLKEVDRLRDEIQTLQGELKHLQNRVHKKVSSARVQRYNAFSETGSDLSFSVALLDDDSNGVVLSSIYGREESRTYAKPVTGGTSRYTLTEEEQDVIAQAAGKEAVTSGKHK